MDVLFDWDQKLVTIYLNGTNKGTANFYHNDVTSVDTVMMYNLNPGTTGYFSSIEVCQDKCTGKNKKLFLSRTNISKPRIYFCTSSDFFICFDIGCLIDDSNLLKCLTI